MFNAYQIQRVVADYYGVPFDSSMSRPLRRGPWRWFHARAVSMYLCRRHLPDPDGLFESIGRAHGGRDRSTASNAVSGIRGRCESEQVLKQELRQIVLKLGDPRVARSFDQVTKET